MPCRPDAMVISSSAACSAPAPGLRNVKERPRRVEKTMSGIGLGGLWTALNHPELGAAMRAKVSQSLRTRGTAHITWRFDKQCGFALVLADHFVDMASVTAVAPRDCVIAYVSASTDTEQSH